MTTLLPDGPYVFDVERMARSLQSDMDEQDLDWLRRSYKERESFLSALAASRRFQPPLPRKSDCSTGVDFYADLVRAYAQSPTHSHQTVLYFSAGSQHWRAVDYAALHTQAIQLAAHWKEQQCTPGMSIVVVLPSSIELLVALCAGLCLGLHIILIPPHGSRYVQNRLKECGDIPIWTLPCHLRLLGSHGSRALSTAMEHKTLFFVQDACDSYTYPENAPVLGIFSPLADSPGVLQSVTAAELYAGALRDALLLGLGQDSSSPKLLCAIDAHPIQHTPSLLFAGLSSGTSMVLMQWADHAEESQLLREILTKHCFSLVLLGESAKEVLASISSNALPAPAKMYLCPFVLRSLRSRSTKWSMAQQHIPYALLHLDTAAAGAVLFSFDVTGAVLPPLLVAPACQYRIESPTFPGQQSLQLCGRLRVLALSAEADAGLLLARKTQADEFYLAGTLHPRRMGRRFPAHEVSELLNSEHGVHGATVLEQPMPGDARIVLLVYSMSDPGRKQKLLLLLERELGSEALPDELLMVPLYPRRYRGQIDHPFYKSQYEQGGLCRLQQDTALLSLSTVRGATLKRQQEVSK
jgi:hypothetical protein